MDIFINLNKQTAGRDRIARLCQYLSKFLSYYLQDKQRLLENNFVNNLKSLEYQLSTFRKLLRWGQCVDLLYSILPLIEKQLDFQTLMDILSRLSQSFYYFTDHILWLGRADFCQINTEKWCQISNRYWLYSIILSLAKNVNDLVKLSVAFGGVVNRDMPMSILFDILRSNFNSQVTETFIMNCKKCKVIFANCIKNICDLFIPLTALGYTNLSPGFVGLMGFLSSVAGLFVLIETMKCIP